jgi:hypothetical protein
MCGKLSTPGASPAFTTVTRSCNGNTDPLHMWARRKTWDFCNTTPRTPLKHLATERLKSLKDIFLHQSLHQWWVVSKIAGVVEVILGTLQWRLTAVG